MIRKQFQRIHDLIDVLHGLNSSSTLFQDLEANPVKRKHLLHIEAELASLDDVAWQHLKNKAAPLLKQRHERRGWELALSELNEAKGYNYLIGIGCTGVEFVPRSRSKTPEFRARLGNTTVLCEVKTINRSEKEIAARGTRLVRETSAVLPNEFFKKISDTIEFARGQMAAYCSETTAKRIVYLVVNFDDMASECFDEYLDQFRHRADEFRIPGLEVVFHFKPKFYFATAHSEAALLFRCSSMDAWLPLPSPPTTGRSPSVQD